jgi:hypothetical protein
MAIGYEWRIIGRELSGGACPDGDADGVAGCVEDVATAITEALRFHLRDQRPDIVGAVLTNMWGPLRHRMLTDGITGLKDERRWTGTAPGLSVRLWQL